MFSTSVCYHFSWDPEQLAKALERQAPKALFWFAFVVGIQRQEKHKSSSIETEWKFYLQKKQAHGWHYAMPKSEPTNCEERRVSQMLPTL